VTSDTISGSTGDDSISGTSENDTIHADYGNDTIFGGAGDDLLLGNQDLDSILGGDGDDTIYAGQNSGGLELDEYGNLKRLTGVETLIGGAGNDNLFGQFGADIISGGSDNDTLFGGQGDDTISGGVGDDFIAGQRGNDAVYGGDGNDLLYGDFINGGDGNDSLFGLSDTWTEHGVAGDATLSGGAGDDYLRAGGIMYGGTGADTFFVGNTIEDFSVAEGDMIDDHGGGYTFLISNSATWTQITSTDGGATTRFTGLSASDITESIFVNAPTLIDLTISSTDGDDTLNATSGDTNISGGDGDDTLIVGGGLNATLTGGSGADIFTLTPGTQATGGSTNYASAGATITDFNYDEGDRIEVITGEGVTFSYEDLNYQRDFNGGVTVADAYGSKYSTISITFEGLGTVEPDTAITYGTPSLVPSEWFL
jgi:Ca2+-binding RTX toxin-like protein